MAGTDPLSGQQAQLAAQGCHVRVRRTWPAWLRVLLAVAVTVALFKVYAGWHWFERIGSGPGVTFSPTKAYVARYSALSWIVEKTSEVLERPPIGQNPIWPSGYWHFAYTIGTILPAALIGVVVYLGLTRRFGSTPVDPHTRCRRCGYILNGLSRPQCPECGERI